MLQHIKRTHCGPELRFAMAAAARLAAHGATAARGQTAATALPEVSVTGTREKALLSETPASVGIIRPEAMRARLIERRVVEQ